MQRSMENMSVMSVLELMPSGKREIQDFTEQVKYNVMNGFVEPLQLLSTLKKIEKTIEILLKDSDISDVFLDAMKETKSVNEYGCLFEITETGTKYDYSSSSEWEEYEKKINDLRTQQKAIETRLKTATATTPYVDSVSGELIMGIPKSSKTTVKTTIV